MSSYIICYIIYVMLYNMCHVKLCYITLKKRVQNKKEKKTDPF